MNERSYSDRIGNVVTARHRSRGAAAGEEAGWIESFQQDTMIPEDSNGQERDRIHCSNGLRIDPQPVQESTVHRVLSGVELK